ncbi:hypothetical protein BRC75_01450, partial [Halobacteriales archaeon QH_7_69_31]
EVFDRVPDGWTVDPEFGDVESFDADEGIVTFDGTVTADQVGDDGEVTFEYFVEAPEVAESSGSYRFGPAFAEVVEPAVPAEDADGELDGDGADDFGGTDTNAVAGVSTSS